MTESPSPPELLVANLQLVRDFFACSQGCIEAGDLQSLSDSAAEQIRRLRGLQDNWDDMGAPRPSELAFQATEKIIKFIEKQFSYKPDDIDADVSGGLALYYGRFSTKTIWISIQNDGRVFVQEL